MFTIILQDELNNEVVRISLSGNELYLPQEDERSFPMLSELSTASYDIFGSQDMGELLLELNTLRSLLTSSNDIKHLGEIINLAKRCKESPGFKVCFTPFALK